VPYCDVVFRNSLIGYRLCARSCSPNSSRRAVKPYQILRYWSTVPFRHGPDDVVMQSLIPAESNSFASLAKDDADALVNELARHVADDHVMSSFDFGLQFLDPQSSSSVAGITMLTSG
jgi:hypothetical protein